MSNSAESNVQLLTPAAMVANLGHQVFTKMGSLKIVTTKTVCYTEQQGDVCSRVEVNGKTLGIFGIVQYMVGVCC